MHTSDAGSEERTTAHRMGAAPFNKRQYVGLGYQSRHQPLEKQNVSGPFALLYIPPYHIFFSSFS